MKTSQRMQIPPSATLSINSMALALKQSGKRVYNLSAGEPMISTDPAIIEAANKAMLSGKTQYGPVNGIIELRVAASNWMNSTYQSSYLPEHCFVTNGGKFALYAICQSYLESSDEALIITPFWVSYSAMVELAGASPIFVQTTYEEGWKVTIQSLEEKRTEKTKILFLNNASNPTGVLYTKQELENILQWAKQHNIFVVSDEVYSGLVYDGEEYVSVASFSQYADMVAVIQSCSKNFAMTGWRVGFVFAQEEFLKPLQTLQGQSTSNTSIVSQWAAVEAYAQAQRITTHICERLQARRDIFVHAWKRHLGVDLVLPKSGLYCFVPISAFGSDQTNDLEFCEQLLKEKYVAVVPGSAFGAPGFVRLSFGMPEKELEEAVAQLGNPIDELNYFKNSTFKSL